MSTLFFSLFFILFVLTLSFIVMLSIEHSMAFCVVLILFSSLLFKGQVWLP